MSFLKFCVGCASFAFFVLGAYQGALIVVDRASVHARLLSAVACGILAMVTLVWYFTVPRL